MEEKPIDKKPEIIAVEINCLFDNNIELHPAQLNTTIQKLFKINGRKILINENQSMAEGTGFKVWDSVTNNIYIYIYYLEPNSVQMSGREIQGE